jgi:uncharacterized membrane protein
MITIGLGIAYVIWGIVHHLIRKEIYWRIVWEYIIVASLACIFVIFILLRS